MTHDAWLWDPDIASSLPLWNACNGQIQWHVPSLWEGFIRHYGALNAEFIGIPDEGAGTTLGNQKLESFPRTTCTRPPPDELTKEVAKVLAAPTK